MSRKRVVASIVRVPTMLAVTLLLAGWSEAATAQMIFRKVEARTTFEAAKQGDNGRLVIDAEKILFAKKNGQQYFSIPTGAVTELFYSRVSGRRIGAAIIFTPFLLFSKGRKHYLTVSFNDGEKMLGAVEFKLHKSNYRGVLRTAEVVTRLTMKYDQEGIKDSEQIVAERGQGQSGRTVLEITSIPPGAEIEIDGAFVGDTPRKSDVAPGRHQMKLKLKGFKDWERKVSVERGKTLEIRAELEK